jgi:hypothetical protein
MVSTPLSWTGVALIVAAIVLGAVVSPLLLFVGAVGLAFVWLAANRAGTVTSYTHHGPGHDDLGGRGADGRRGTL